MTYKVFLVEDEIVTREGIRDNVDWEAFGFEFCGEAPDGEMALPLIEDTKPDVLITDIKMPFMDGIQLSKIIRENMPWIKILILSGHNEFEYAQSAVKLGVTDYLLKPISANDIHEVLADLARSLDQEKQESENLANLKNKVEDNLIMSREKFLLKLLMGGISSAEALEQSQQLGLDIIARYYSVVIIRIELCKDSPPFDYQEYQHVEQILSDILVNKANVFLAKKDFEEILLLIKGDHPEKIIEEGEILSELINNKVENQTTCSTVIEMGSCQARLSDIHHSFTEAFVITKFGGPSQNLTQNKRESVDLVSMDQEAIDDFLKSGSIDEFDDFFSRTIQPVAEIAQQSSMVKNYVFVDIILTCTQFINNLGGAADESASDIQEVEVMLRELNSMQEIKAEIKRIFKSVLDFRNQSVINQRKPALQQAKAYLDNHFHEPELRMSSVARKFNISPSHFSTSFHEEFGITFRDYVSQTRLNHAKELLRTTSLKSSEIAYQCGFNDSHYFSYVFKKKIGLSPREFRSNVAKI